MSTLTTFAHLSPKELSQACTCDDDNETYCDACFIAGALEAGIPRQVIFGQTKLSDHFSEEYIKAQCPREDV